MNAGRRLTRPLLSTGKTQRRQRIIYAYFNKVCYPRETWCMIHDPCFMTCGALCEQAQFVISPRRTRKTSVRVRFGFHIFVGIKQKKPGFILEYPNGLKGTTCLVKIVSGDVDAKKMGWPSWSVPWNPTTARQQERHKNYRFNKAKQPFFTCSSLFFCTFHYHHRTTTRWKCLISRFIEDVNKRRRNFLSLS